MGFQKSFKALGDPVRREILSLLRREPMAAGDIAAHFDLSGATVSHHLAILRDAVSGSYSSVFERYYHRRS